MKFLTFSSRKKMQKRSEEPELYQYDSIPEHLRRQICIAFSEGVGDCVHVGNSFRTYPNANDAWDRIDSDCFKEIPKYPALKHGQDSRINYLDYISSVQEIDWFLDAFEIGCRILSRLDMYKSPADRGASVSSGEALEEINFRFEQHAVGYKFENGYVISVESKFVHSEVVKPALVLLSEPLFKKANEEFMRAHRHFRSEEYKDSINSANRAFETTLKIICDKEGWSYDKGSVAAQLITVLKTNGVFSHNFDRNFDSFIAMLKSGLPSIRNDAGGHGESLLAASVSSEVARFALNLAASNITFIISCYRRIAR